MTSRASNSAEQYDFALKLLLIGESGVGKTCLLLRYANDSFRPTFLSTIGIDFKIKNCQLNQKKVRLQVWDTAGQERFRTITTAYFRGAHCVLLCYAVNDRKSFDSIKYWSAQANLHGSIQMVKILVACKCDLVTDRKVHFEEGEALARSHGMDFFEVSSMDDICVDHLFTRAAETTAKTLSTSFVFDDFIVRGGKSWFNGNKINGRYVPDKLPFSLGDEKLCYRNIDSPGTLLLQDGLAWVIRKNSKVLAVEPGGTNSRSPAEAVQGKWRENHGIYFTWLYDQPDLLCRILTEADANDAMHGIFDWSGESHIIDLDRFTECCKEPEQLGLTLKLFVRYCHIKLDLLTVKFADYKAKLNFAAMEKLQNNRTKVVTALQTLTTVRNSAPAPRRESCSTKQSIIAEIKAFDSELDAHFESLCSFETGNFQAAQRCRGTRLALLAEAQALEKELSGDISSSEREDTADKTTPNRIEKLSSSSPPLISSNAPPAAGNATAKPEWAKKTKKTHGASNMMHFLQRGSISK